MTKDLCRRCGRCCLVKVSIHGGLSVALNRHCPHYMVDKGMGTCRIYEKHTGTKIGMAGQCLSIPEMISRKLLPTDCPYAKEVPGYKSAVINYREGFHEDWKNEAEDVFRGSQKFQERDGAK